MKHRPRRLKQNGFSLVEMAIVLAIVALLLGSLLPTISSQIEQQRRNETRKQLVEIQQALLGFAILNGRLPCATTILDPGNAGYGLETSPCALDVATEGYLPWKTLGVSETDAWGSKRYNAGDPMTGYWRYRVARNFAVIFSISTVFPNDKLSIVDNNNSLITPATGGCAAGTSECPVAIVFSTGPDLQGNGQNANTSFEPSNGIYRSDVPTPTFDDMLIWISRPLLFNRMVAAGRLP